MMRRVDFQLGPLNGTMANVIAGSRAQPRGVIDSLAVGFGIITRRPILALLPVLLDILILIAPGVKSEALPASAHALLSDAVAQNPLPPDSAKLVMKQVEEVRTFLASWNLLSLVSYQVPTLSGTLANVPAEVKALSLGTLGSTAAFGLGAAAVGLLLACLYLARLADAVAREPRDEQPNAPARAARTPRRSIPSILIETFTNWYHFCSLRVFQAAFLVALGVVGGTVFNVAAGLGSLVLGMAFGITVLSFVFLFVSEEALIVGKLSSLAAIRESIVVVRRNFGASALLWLLVTIITIGLRLIWVYLAGTPAGSLVAVLGNAYIATGLTTAVLVFYYDRRTRVPQNTLMGGNAPAQPL